MKELASRECVPCKGGTPPLKGDALAPLVKELPGEWKVVDEHHLERAYSLKDFRQALDLTIKIGELAEAVGHHPDISLSWGKVKVSIWTHKIDGLTESDFILAAKIETIRQEGAAASPA